MRNLTIEAQPYKGECYKKAWGCETVIIDSELYCSKLLVFKKGKQCSMHFHLLKDKTWCVSKGEFLYKYIDTETTNKIEMTIGEGDCIHLMPGQPHQILALTDDAIIFETSTKHSNDDNYKVMPGSTQEDNYINLPI